MRYPKEVPVLTTKNMTIGPYHDGECGCVLYWVNEIYKKFPAHLDQSGGIFTSGHKKVDELRKSLGNELGIMEGYTCKNHCGCTTKKSAARLVNRINAEMGYTEGNPECNPDGSLISV